MSLQLVTAVAQLASAAAIVPSLVFVGLQINHAGKAVKASASQAHAATYHAVSAAIVDSHDGFAEIWRKGLQATDRLTEGERVRFFAFVCSMLRFFDAARIQRLRDQLDQEHWQAIERQAKDVAAEPGMRAFWEACRHWHCIHFR
jgi:G3E family GTPase